MRPDIRAVAEALWQDAQYGARVLSRSRGVTFVIVLALALGIGANSAMFSVVDAILLHPLNYERPQELCVIFDRDAQGQLRSTSSSNFLEWRKARSFSAMAAWAPSVYVLDGDQPVQVYGARVTANMFEVLGAKPFLGRTFLNGEDGLDGSATVSKVVVISYGLWKDALGLDPDVLGRVLRLSGTPFTVIGVMPKGFELINRRHQLWLPAVLTGTNRDYRYLTVVGRRNTAASDAVSEMRSISLSLAEAFPGNNRGWSAYPQDMHEWLVDQRTRSRLLLLLAALGLVLLLACSNVAGLLLARSASRTREIALRVSLGATRGRIIAQLLAESLLLSMMGGAVGLLVAWALVEIAPGYVPVNALGPSAIFELNLRVVAFSLILSVLTGILFGLAPALAASRTNVRDALQDSTRSSTGGRTRQAFRQAVVAGEIAVALALLSGAVLTVSSLRRLATVDVGLDTNNVLTQRIFLPASTYDSARTLALHRQILSRVAEMPGVTQAALGGTLPLSRPNMEVAFDLESDPVRAMADMRSVVYITASPGYFNVLKIPILAGREFADTDSQDAPRVAIVNQAFARRYFPNGEIVGQRLRVARPVLGTNDFEPIDYVRIVGIAGNVSMDDIGVSASPVLYVPVAQNVWTTAHWLAVRTASSSSAVAANVRRVIRELDPAQPLDPSTSLEERFSAQFAAPRFQSVLMGLFAVLALLLAAVGIYSVNAYAVTQRTREIGLRLALGASPAAVIQGLFRQGMTLAMIGIVAGLVAAAAMNSVLSSILTDIAGFEARPVLGAALVLMIAAASACLLPAWRATRIDPAITLRKE
jgi:putative ABC transport system permease protein